jgi:beta-N-acetylhexosaminidase
MKPLDSWPATMSQITLTELLRKQMGFVNAIISDDLTMKAVADNYSLREILLRSMHAGVDLFIIGNDFELTREAIAILDELIAHDEIVRKQACASRERIALLRGRYLGKPLAPDLSTAKAIVRSEPHLDLVRSVVD